MKRIELNDGNYVKYDNKVIFYFNKKDQIHRDNGLPAIIWKRGIFKWYKNGKYHRDNNQPAIIFETGMCEWWENGKFKTDQYDLSYKNSVNFDNELYNVLNYKKQNIQKTRDNIQKLNELVWNGYGYI